MTTSARPSRPRPVECRPSKLPPTGDRHNDQGIDRVRRRRDFSGNAKTVAQTLDRLCFGDAKVFCWPSDRLIADRSGLSETKVRFALAELEAGGALFRLRSHDGASREKITAAGIALPWGADRPKRRAFLLFWRLPGGTPEGLVLVRPRPRAKPAPAPVSPTLPGFAETGACAASEPAPAPVMEPAQAPVSEATELGSLQGNLPSSSYTEETKLPEPEHAGAKTPEFGFDLRRRPETTSTRPTPTPPPPPGDRRKPTWRRQHRRSLGLSREEMARLADDPIIGAEYLALLNSPPPPELPPPGTPLPEMIRHLGEHPLRRHLASRVAGELVEALRDRPGSFTFWDRLCRAVVAGERPFASLLEPFEKMLAEMDKREIGEPARYYARAVANWVPGTAQGQPPPDYSPKFPGGG